ncbi:hypothetical protein LCGC14_3031980 [marine sediment metagenome]|uniref:Uncharacterized protein n=1 Tax=marine sediment metagenome TaxID=412755 RepID=A0A0F8ZI90_9ZZZZ
MTAPTAAGLFLNMYKIIPTYALNRAGIEIHYAPSTAFDNLQIAIGYQDGDAGHFGRLRVNQSANEIVVGGNTVAFTKVLDYKLSPLITGHWFVMKLVVDFDANQYLRGTFNEQEIDLSAFSLEDVVTSTAPAFQIMVTVESVGGTNAVAFVDDAIMTVDEP